MNAANTTRRATGTVQDASTEEIDRGMITTESEEEAEGAVAEAAGKAAGEAAQEATTAAEEEAAGQVEHTTPQGRQDETPVEDPIHHTTRSAATAIEEAKESTGDDTEGGGERQGHTTTAKGAAAKNTGDAKNQRAKQMEMALNG
jgi:uncharacterized protein YjbJ (UPF0337 family)